MYHHYYLQRPDIGIPHVKIGIISKKQWKVADFYKRKLDSNIGNCIIILTEPTTPLIFHAQPGGTFSFMGCFMYQYPKQILTIEQQVQSYVDAGMEITSYEDVEKVLKTIGFYRLRGYSFHLYDNATKKFNDVFIKHNFDNHDGEVPVWAIVEVLSFGTLSKIIKNLKTGTGSSYFILASNYQYKSKKGNLVKPSQKMLTSWIQGVSVLRNMCAHNSRIYNRTIHTTPEILDVDKITPSPAHNGLYQILLAMKYLRSSDEEWIVFVDAFDKLIQNNSDVVGLTAMNLPTDWKDHLSV